MEQFNVLLIGDSCTDRYNIGTVDRLSPEAPVPVVKIVNEYTLPGMASNVFFNLKTLGVPVDFVHNTEEIVKTRYIDQRSGQHLLRVDAEPVIEPWNRNTPKSIETYDAVVISDYNKGFLGYDSIESIISQASGPVFIDTKKQHLSHFSNAYLKINELEYKAAKTFNSNLIVTLGAKGAMYKTDTETEMFHADKVDVVDVCGCGDTFLSALVYKFLLTKDIKRSIVFANDAAAITVQKQGNYAPTLEEINARHRFRFPR